MQLAHRHQPVNVWRRHANCTSVWHQMWTHQVLVAPGCQKRTFKTTVMPQQPAFLPTPSFPHPATCTAISNP